MMDRKMAFGIKPEKQALMAWNEAEAKFFCPPIFLSS